MKEKSIDPKNSGTKNKIQYIIHQLSQKEKIIWVLQMVITITILVLAILGLNDILPITLTNMIDVILLIFLFLICGIRLIPERIVYAVIYFVVAALMCAILVASFFI